MNILKSIYQQENLDDYYANHNSTSLEVLLALSFYLTDKTASSLTTLHTVSKAFNRFDNTNKFSRFVRTFVGFDVNFYEKMQDVGLMKNFLENHYDSLLEKIDYWTNKSHIGNKKIDIEALERIRKVVKQVVPSRRQEDITDTGQSLSYFEDIRICDVKTFQNAATMQALEEDLLLNVYNCFKFKNLPLNEIDNYIDKTRDIRNDFIKNSTRNDATFSPLFSCLHKDIISALTKKPNRMLSELNFENLWLDIDKLDVSNISIGNFETIPVPLELKQLIKDNEVKQGIYVLMLSGEVFFAERNTKNFTDEVRHIDLANGKDVVSAGTILFSKDMTKILAINPGSGHYKPNVESCIPMIKILEKSSLDTNNLAICDLDWKPFKGLESKQVVNSSIVELREKLNVNKNNKSYYNE